MKLASYNYQGALSIGKVFDEEILDLPAACPGLPRDMLTLLAAGEPAMQRVRAARREDGICHPLSEVDLCAPVLSPRKFLAAGMNYHSHVEEVRQVPEMKNYKLPEVPVFFNKQVTCINGPYATIELPAVSTKLDYEVELLVVIGKRCRHVSKEHANEVIAGYCVSNDVSVRDWQLASPTIMMGKSFDTHGPCGPWITTPDEVDLTAGLTLQSWVNGELRQSNHTRDMIHSISRQIEYLSSAFTLEPGDLIATGTPAGVGLLMQPPTFMKVGDVVRCAIQGLGHIENTVVAPL